MGTPLPAFVAVAALLHGDGTFSWTNWEIHLSVLLGCLLFAGVYLVGVGPLRRQREWADRVSPARLVSFLGGIVVIFVALNGPIHDLSDNYLFSAHMVQHLLLTLVMPPLLVLGTPPWLLRPILRRRRAASAARFLTRPLIAYAVYNIVLLGWHFPGAYNLALVNHDVHIVQHLMFMAAAVIMWWPVLNPVPELTPTLASPLQIIYLFAMGIPMSALSAMVTLSDGLLYPWYGEAPRLWELSALADQQLGGLIMWVPGGITFWIAISIVFYRWSRREELEERRARRQLQVAAASK